MEDAGELHRIFGDPEVMCRIPSGPSKNLEETKKRLNRIIQGHRERGYGLWAVIRREDGELIGNCGIIPVEGVGPEVELSYDFRRESWGKGYATEAARVCLRFGLEDLGFRRIIAITYPDHLASRRVMEKAGMHLQGAGRYYKHDMVVYAITRVKQ
jgi:ribosomal-protein-alanine N-acetyltransferase